MLGLVVEVGLVFGVMVWLHGRWPFPLTGSGDLKMGLFIPEWLAALYGVLATWGAGMALAGLGALIRAAWSRRLGAALWTAGLSWCAAIIMAAQVFNGWSSRFYPMVFLNTGVTSPRSLTGLPFAGTSIPFAEFAGRLAIELGAALLFYTTAAVIQAERSTATKSTEQRVAWPPAG